MKKSELKALIKEVIQEIAANRRFVVSSPSTTPTNKSWEQDIVASSNEEALKIANSNQRNNPTTLNFVKEVPLNRRAAPSPAARQLSAIQQDIENRGGDLDRVEMNFDHFVKTHDAALERDAAALGDVVTSLKKRSVSITENAPSQIAKNLKWKDGTSVGVDATGNPVGYKSLGSLNSGITLPKTDDWRKFFASPNGNSEKFLSPKLKVWYDVDSSG